MYQRIYYNNYLMHHGVKGQKWGIRRFQNSDGSLTAEGKRRYDSANFDSAKLAKEVRKMKKEAYADFKASNPEASLKTKLKVKKAIGYQLKGSARKYTASNVTKFTKSNLKRGTIVSGISAGVYGAGKLAEKFGPNTTVQTVGKLLSQTGSSAMSSAVLNTAISTSLPTLYNTKLGKATTEKYLNYNKEYT